MGRKKYPNTVQIARITDDSEGQCVVDFINGIIEKYELRKKYPEVEVRWRGINYDTSSPHATDDKMVQLVCQNRLIAMVYMRRDDWNYTELTMVFVGDALKACEDFEKKLGLFKKKF
jgi:hypothetical protein